MDISIFLAKIFGIYLLVGGISVFIHRDQMDDIMRDFRNNKGLQLWGGAFALIIGLLLVNVHNVWVASWEVIITILAWASLVKGALFMLSPKTMFSISKTLTSGSMLTVSAIMMVLAGAWLSYISYLM